MKFFEMPDVEIIKMTALDVITTSGEIDEGEGGKGEFPIG